MPLINIRHLHYSLQSKELFNDLDFLLSAGEKITIVGENGVGKSTFLRFLNQPTISYEGIREIAGSTGYLPQSFGDTAVMSALEYLIRVSERSEWLAAIKDNFSSIQWQELFHSLGGYTVYEELRQLHLSPKVLEQPINTLSGGEKTKLHLCALYHKQPDILLLDEPTNHPPTQAFSGWVFSLS